MRKILLAAAAVMCFTTDLAPVVAFGAGLPVLRLGVEGHKALDLFIARYQAALRRDQNGNAAIEGGMCGYSPRMLYEAIRHGHPELNLPENPSAQDFENLGAYLSTLELHKLEHGGLFYDSRMVQQGGSCTHDYMWTHELSAGTAVWVDRNTGVPVMKENCGNVLAPVERHKPKSPCVYIDVPVRWPTERLLHWAKMYNAHDSCFAVRHVTHRHEADNGVGWQTPSQEECGCQFDSVTDETGDKPVLKGVVHVTPGIWQWRLSPEDAMAFCLEESYSNAPPFSSFTAFVRWREHYRLDPDHVWRAEVKYASPETVEQVQDLGEMNLWLWARDEQIAEAVSAHATAR